MSMASCRSGPPGRVQYPYRISTVPMGQRPRPQEREEANGIFGLIAAQRVSIIGSDPKDVTGSVAYSRVRGTIPSTGSVASVCYRCVATDATTTTIPSTGEWAEPIPSTSWRKRSDLNRQHSHRQCDALPVELLLLLR